MSVPRSSFVGRTAELEAVRAALADHRLVTVTGMGGAGKTRLALELGAEAALRYRDGATLVELAPLRTFDAIVAAVSGAGGSGPRPHRGADRLGALVETLRTREMLLIVDNCEHVRPDVARIIDVLLDGCPAVIVLATSREPLRLAGERTISIGPLPVEPASVDRPSEAVRLFVDRATAVRSDLTLDADTFADVVAVCRSVDGIPLAIELAAARVSHLSPGEIARRLTTHPESVSSRQLDTPHRHHTLTATLDWSYELLSEAERSLFRSLAAFVGGAGLAAIATVCLADDVDEREALEVLSGLVDKNLVLTEEAGGTTRYRMIDTVRRYAWSRLEGAGQVASTRRRQVSWLIERARRRTGPADGPDPTGDMLDDVVGALTWAIDEQQADLTYALAAATWRCWEVTGRHSEGRQLLDRVLALPGDGRSSDRARVTVAAASLALAGGDYAAARRQYEEGIARFRELGLTRELANALNSLAMVALLQEDVPRAHRLASEALARSRDLDGDAATQAFASSSLGMIEAGAGHARESELHFLDALSVFRRLGLDREAASVLNNLGNLAADAGDPGRAHRFYEGALQLQRRIGDDRGAALSLNNLSLAAQQRGNLDRAWEHAEAARQLFRDIRDRPGEAATVNNLANLAAERGRPGQAMDLYARCISTFREIGDARRLATALANLADLAAAVGERQLAWEAVVDATSLWNQLGDRAGVDGGLRDLALFAADWDVTGAEGLDAVMVGERDPAAVSHGLEAARWASVPAVPEEQRRPQTEQLTTRETQVVTLVARGMTNAEIAGELFISERTVESHVSNARLKLGIDSRTKLTRWAIEHGLLDRSSSGS